MVTDPIADLLTRIRNASRAGHLTITAPGSKAKERVLEVLKQEGFVDRIEAFKDPQGKGLIKVFLRYDQDGEPVIKEIHRGSKPGRRVYLSCSDVKPFKGGLGINVISTSRGVVTDRQAKELKVGGELLCSVF